MFKQSKAACRLSFLIRLKASIGDDTGAVQSIGMLRGSQCPLRLGFAVKILQ